MKAVRLTKKNAVILFLLSGVLLTALVLAVSDPGGFGIREVYNAATTEGRERYLNSLGWEIDPASEECRSILLPAKLDGVLADYAAMQDEQGFGFSSYAGREVTVCTYTVTSYPNYAGTVYAVIYVRGNRVIGGDIHAAEIGGFMHGLR